MARPDDRRAIGTIIAWVAGLLLVVSVLLFAGLHPWIPCPECGGQGEVQYVHTVTAAKSDCPRCRAERRVTFARWLPRRDSRFH